MKAPTWSVAFVIMAMALLHDAVAQKSLSVEQCRELALRNSAAGRNSALEIAIAQQARRSAFTNYFPNVSAGGIMFRAQKSLMEMRTSGGNLPVYDGNPAHLGGATQFAYMPASTVGFMRNGNIGFVNMVQPVFAGGRIVNGNRLAALGEEVGELRARITRDKTVLSTEEKYWRIVSLTEKRNTVLRAIALLDGVERQVADAGKAGIATMNDVLKVRLKRSEALLNQSKLENGISIAMMDFRRDLGLSDDSLLVLTDTLAVGAPPESWRVDIGEAVKQRAEYALLLASIRAEELRTRMKFGEYLPQLGIGLNGTIMKFDEGESRTIGMAFATLQVPISGWWEAAHALDERRLVEEMARNNFTEAAGLLKLQMEKTWRDMSDAFLQVRLSDEARAKAEENLRVSRDGHANGIVTVTDVLEAQAMLQKAADESTDARMHYRILVLGYRQMTGR